MVLGSRGLPQPSGYIPKDVATKFEPRPLDSHHVRHSASVVGQTVSGDEICKLKAVKGSTVASTAQLVNTNSFGVVVTFQFDGVVVPTIGGARLKSHPPHLEPELQMS